MANDAEIQQAPPQRSGGGGLGGSFGRLKAWAGEKPWHMWALILIGLATLYLMYRIWKGNNKSSSGGFFAGLGGPSTSPVTPPPPGPTPPTGPTHWWDSLLHSKGKPSDTDITDPANAQAEGYYTVGSAPGGGMTLNQIAAFFGLKGGWRDLFFNPNNKGLPTDPNAVLASGTEVWITRSTMQT